MPSQDFDKIVSMNTRTIPNDILIPEIKRFIDDGHTAIFRVRGNSMRLFLKDGRDKVVLAPCQKAEVRDVVLAEITPGHYVLHRIIKKEGNRLTLKGDGNVYGTEECTTDNIVGIATGFMRKGRNTIDSVNGRKWRIYSHLWLMLTPLRRYILGICRRLGI